MQLRCAAALLVLFATCDAQTYTIEPGIAAQGWCDGFDMAPDESMANPTTAQECYNNCLATYDTTIAVDFWPDREAGRNCWCQDACECLKPSLPDGGTGVLYIPDGVTKGPSCGYNLYMILENDPQNGWCYSNDIEIEGVTNHHQCWDECTMQHNATAIDYFADREDGPDCFCEFACDCLSPSKAGGGDGYLAIGEEDVPLPDDTCYKMMAGIGESGWCMSALDSAPNSDLGTPTTAFECYTNCKATYADTIAVDFWMVDHPNRNEGNICWCQTSCDCVMPSKSDAGNGVLFIEGGVMRGEPCSGGYNMKTIVEGNENGLCDGLQTPASVQPGGMYGCQEQCLADGFDLATWFSTSSACHCQMEAECMCTQPIDIGMGSGYTFFAASMAMRAMCMSVPQTCGEVKELYRSNQCCGMPEQSFDFNMR